MSVDPVAVRAHYDAFKAVGSLHRATQSAEDVPALLAEVGRLEEECAALRHDRNWEAKRANEAAQLSADAQDRADDLAKEIAGLRDQLDDLRMDRLDQDNAALNILVEHGIPYTLDDLLGPIARYIRACKSYETPEKSSKSA